MLCWSKHSIAPSPDLASDWRVRARRYLCSLWKLTRSSKSTCVMPGACSGRCHWCIGFRSSASTGKNLGLPLFLAMAREHSKEKRGQSRLIRWIVELLCLPQERTHDAWLPIRVLELDQRVVRPAAVAERQEVGAVQHHFAVAILQLVAPELVARDARVQVADREGLPARAGNERHAGERALGKIQVARLLL